MTSCNQSAPRVIDYLDGALCPDDQANFEAHLAGCPACADEVTAYRQIQSAFRTADNLPTPPALAPETLQEAHQRPRRSFPWPMLLAASLLITIGFNSGLFDRGPSFETLMERATRHATSGQWFATVDALEAALAADPDHPRSDHALFNLALAHLYSGDAVLSLHALDCLRDQNPDQPEALEVMLMRGRLQTDLGHNNEALAIYAESLALYPDQADLINARSQDLTIDINQGLSGLGYTGYL